MRKSHFSIDSSDIDEMFVGYTRGERWNGWACPFFTKEVGDEMFRRFSNEDQKWFFNEEKDAFTVYEDPDNPTQDTIYEFEGFDIEYNGETIHVYPIGAWCWIWDEWTDEELERLEEDEDE